MAIDDRPNRDTESARDHPLIKPFPPVGPQMRRVYRELGLAANGTPEQKRALGNPDLLPRPWDPASCRDPDLRAEVWAYLDDVACWVNSEYVWDVRAAVPTCWPLHPHVVHELAVLADQRHQAGRALTSGPLEEWHRFTLPAFVDRMRQRLKDHCEEGHQPWPSRSRYARLVSDIDVSERRRLFSDDLLHVTPHQPPESRPCLTVVDLDTGEIHGDS